MKANAPSSVQEVPGSMEIMNYSPAMELVPSLMCMFNYVAGFDRKYNV